jgi:hypothetical protein
MLEKAIRRLGRDWTLNDFIYWIKDETEQLQASIGPAKE